MSDHACPHCRRRPSDWPDAALAAEERREAEVERLREALDAIRRDDFDRAIHPNAAALAGYVLNAS